MKRIKKFVALALAATMMVAPASTAFAAKSAQTGDTEPTAVTSTVDYTIDIPMIKVDGKWKIDPAFAYIGIKNIKWNSKIVDMSINKSKKLGVDVNTKYAPYALLLKQKGTIVPSDEPLKTPNIKVTFWVRGDRQKLLYTRHEVILRFVKREAPFVMFKIGTIDLTNFYDGNFFATTNTEKYYKLAKNAWRTFQVQLKPYYKGLKLVAIRKDGRKEVIRSTSGRKLLCAYNLKDLKAIEIRFKVDRAATNASNPYKNYLKDGVGVPGNETLTLKIR